MGSSINDVTLKVEEGVHTSVTKRDEGGWGRIECCDVMQDSL